MAVIGQPSSMEVLGTDVLLPAWIRVDPTDHELVSSYQGGPEKPRLLFHMMTDDGHGAYVDLFYYTGANLSKHVAAKLRPLVKAAAPEIDLDDPNIQFDSESLHERWVRVLLGYDEEKGRNTVERVLPYETAAVKPAAPVAAPARPAAPAPRPPGTHVREPASAGPATRGAVNLPPKPPGAPARSSEPVREGPAPTDADAPTDDQIPF